MDQRLRGYLKGNKIEYKEYTHPAVFNVEESRKLKEKIPGMHCKCLFLKDDKDKFYLVGMKADKRLGIKKLEKYFGVKKIKFGSAEELIDVLELKPGSVSIFAMINIKEGDRNIKLIIDKEVWNAKTAGFHPNVNTSTLVLTGCCLLEL
jgi:Ala-tRNA(Pro) deacylase